MMFTRNCSIKYVKPTIIKNQKIITRIQNIKVNNKNYGKNINLEKHNLNKLFYMKYQNSKNNKHNLQLWLNYLLSSNNSVSLKLLKPAH